MYIYIYIHMYIHIYLTAASSARRPSALTDVDTAAPTIVASRRANGLGIPRQTREISIQSSMVNVNIYSNIYVYM
jgi:hypothetical protein